VAATRRWLALVLVLGAVVAAPFASGGASTTNAAIVIAGSTSTTYTVTVTNTGTEPIRCWVVAAEVGAKALSGPAGWRTRITSDTRVFAGSSDVGIPPGGSAVFSLTTLEPYPLNAGADAFVSSTCQGGGDVGVRATGPAPFTPTGGTPCVCRALSVALEKMPRLRPAGHQFALGFAWKLTCTSGSGNCSGNVAFKPPKIVAAPGGSLRLAVKPLRAACRGNCSVAKAGRVATKTVSRTPLATLFGRKLVYTISTKCGGTTKTTTVKIAIDRVGRLKRIR